MDRIVHRVLRFDRFALDLARGCLRAGDQQIDLRPKTFEVLGYLVGNAGRLVLKKELFDAVWPNVSVCDDSLVQCIRELRHKLGDDERRLIKTVSRRGYLLDVAVSTQALPSCAGPAVHMPHSLQKLAPAPDLRRRTWRAIAAHGLSLCVAAAIGCAALIVLLGQLPSLVADRGPVSHADRASAAQQWRPTFKDCADCPEMVALPAGEFMMGSPKDERGRQSAEGPPRRVVIPKQIAIGKFELTVDQFSVFAAETGMAVGSDCQMIVRPDGGSPSWGPPEASFRHPGFEVSGSQPVVCVSWHEAQAYVAWLSRRTGKPYRLPSEAEWEYAARAGTTTMYSSGDDETALCSYARFSDLGSGFAWRGGCRSDTVAYGPLPVGSLKPNPWGIFDMHGNAWEWVEDCWTPDASKIPTDGSAFLPPGGCMARDGRGGSWANGAWELGSSVRRSFPAENRLNHIGFRVALSLGE